MKIKVARSGAQEDVSSIVMEATDKTVDIHVSIVGGAESMIVQRRNAFAWWGGEDQVISMVSDNGTQDGENVSHGKLTITREELPRLRTRLIRIRVGSRTMRTIHVVRARWRDVAAVAMFASVLLALVFVRPVSTNLVLRRCLLPDLEWLKAVTGTALFVGALDALRGFIKKPLLPRFVGLVHRPEWALSLAILSVVISFAVQPRVATLVVNRLNELTYQACDQSLVVKSEETIAELHERQLTLGEVAGRLNNNSRTTVDGCCVYQKRGSLWEGKPCGQWSTDKLDPCEPELRQGAKDEPAIERGVQRYVIGCSARPWNQILARRLRKRHTTDDSDTRRLSWASVRTTAEGEEQVYLELKDKTCAPKPEAAAVLDAAALVELLRGARMEGSGDVKLVYSEHRDLAGSLGKGPWLTVRRHVVASLESATQERTLRKDGPASSALRLTLPAGASGAGPIPLLPAQGVTRPSLTLGASSAPIDLTATPALMADTLTCPTDRGESVDVWLLPLREKTIQSVRALDGDELSVWRRMEESRGVVVPAALCLRTNDKLGQIKVAVSSQPGARQDGGANLPEMLLPQSLWRDSMVPSVEIQSDGDGTSIGTASCQSFGLKRVTGYRLAQVRVERTARIAAIHLPGDRRDTLGAALWRHKNTSHAPWVCVADGFLDKDEAVKIGGEPRDKTASDAKLRCTVEACELVLAEPPRRGTCYVNWLGRPPWYERTGQCQSERRAAQHLGSLPAGCALSAIVCN